MKESEFKKHLLLSQIRLAQAKNQAEQKQKLLAAKALFSSGFDNYVEKTQLCAMEISNDVITDVNVNQLSTDITQSISATLDKLSVVYRDPTYEEQLAHPNVFYFVADMDY